MQPLKCQRLFSHFIGVKMNRHGGIGYEKGTAARAVRARERRCLRRPWPSAWPSGLFLEKSNRKKFSAFVIFPQCPEKSSWANTTDYRGPDIKLIDEPGEQMKLVFELLDMLKQTLPIDNSRIYLSGLSMGGYGTLDAIMRRPNEFAAAMPICGGGDTSKASTISHIPTWIFHGAVDSVVPVELSRSMYKVLLEANGNVKYSEYEGVDHNSWENAFAEEEYLSWMFNQIKP